MVKRCAYGICKTDSRYPERLAGGVVFFPFPKPKTQLERCLKWIRHCGRPLSQLNLAKINKHTYVCSKHFLNGQPTPEYPNPVPALQATSQSREQLGGCRNSRKRLRFSVQNVSRSDDAEVVDSESERPPPPGCQLEIEPEVEQSTEKMKKLEENNNDLLYFCTSMSSRMMQAGVCLRQDTETTLPELTGQHRIRQKEEELSGLQSVHMAETECSAPGLSTLEPECVTAHSGVSDVHHTQTSLMKTETDLGSTHTGDLKTESLDFTELEHLTRLHPDQIKTEADDGEYLQAEHASGLQDIICVKIEFDEIKCESSESSVGDLMNTIMSGAGVDNKDQTEPWQCTRNPNCKKEINNLPAQCGHFSHHCDVHDEHDKHRNVQERTISADIIAHCQRVKVEIEPMPIHL